MGGTTASQGLRYPYVTDTITHTNLSNLGDDAAAKLTTEDTNRSLVLHRPSFRVTRFAVQSFADGVDTATSFDTELWDTDNLWVIGTPTRVTFTTATAGVWHLIADIDSGNINFTKYQVRIRKNGTTIVANRSYWGAAGQGPIKAFCSNFVTVANTDYVEAMLLHIGNGATNLSALALTGHRVTAP